MDKYQIPCRQSNFFFLLNIKITLLKSNWYHFAIVKWLDQGNLFILGNKSSGIRSRILAISFVIQQGYVCWSPLQNCEECEIIRQCLFLTEFLSLALKNLSPTCTITVKDSKQYQTFHTVIARVKNQTMRDLHKGRPHKSLPRCTASNRLQSE